MKGCKLVFYILTISIQFSKGQQNQELKIIDSLKKSLPVHTENSTLEYINTLNGIATQYVNFQPDSALKYANISNIESRQLSYERGLAESHFTLGQIFANHGTFSKAISSYSEAIKYFQLIGQWQGLAETYNALGNLYYYTHQHQEALKQHETALAICTKYQLKKQEAITLGHLGHFYEKQSDYHKALEYQNKALEIYVFLKDNEGLSTINGNIGSIYEDLGKLDLARTYFEKALEYNLKTTNAQERIIHLNNLGDSYRKQNRLEKVLELTTQSLELAKQLEQNYQMKSAYRDLSETYALMGNFEAAHQNLNTAFDLYEGLYDQESARQIASMKHIHEMWEQEHEIEVLEREKRIALITRNAFFGGVVMLGLLGIIILYLQRLKLHKNKQLFQAKQELVEAELKHAQLSERNLKVELDAKSAHLSNHALHIIQKNKILKELKQKLTVLKQHYKEMEHPLDQLILKINASLNFDEDWESFQQNFRQLHPEFYEQLTDHFDSLTAAEIRLCALLKLNLDSKDIAAILGISQDSLRVTRYRLRKKMQVAKGTNLTNFIMNI